MTFLEKAFCPSWQEKFQGQIGAGDQTSGSLGLLLQGWPKKKMLSWNNESERFPISAFQELRVSEWPRVGQCQVHADQQLCPTLQCEGPLVTAQHPAWVILRESWSCSWLRTSNNPLYLFPHLNPSTLQQLSQRRTKVKQRCAEKYKYY